MGKKHKVLCGLPFAGLFFGRPTSPFRRPIFSALPSALPLFRRVRRGVVLPQRVADEVAQLGGHLQVGPLGHHTQSGAPGQRDQIDPAAPGAQPQPQAALRVWKGGLPGLGLPGDDPVQPVLHRLPLPAGAV